ncbi:MAG: hypothetical protein H6625_10385 [Bdellovibrionaceae bacterium]|nr:hypothetical protein [Pseudobdellovibrionaceae bacterium]
MTTKETFTQQKGPQSLFRTGALGPGSNLWVVPNGDSSEWSKKLDWYLNFQISKAMEHIPNKISPEFSKNLLDYEIQPLEFKQKSDLLMISCGGRLPTKMLVIVPLRDNLKDWIDSIYQVWLNLLKPNLRIFLPNDFPINEFSIYWPDRNSITEITLVPSQKQQQS